MKKLLTITYTNANCGDVPDGVCVNTFIHRNGYALRSDVVKTILNGANDFVANYGPKKILQTGLELRVYRIGKLILAIDKITLHKSKRWLNSFYGLFDTEDFNNDEFNFVIAIESKIITLPLSLILSTSRIFIGLSESTIDINYINILNNKKWKNIIFKRSRFHVGGLYLPGKERIYFMDSFYDAPELSFYSRNNKYYVDMDIDIKIKSELSTLVISRLKYRKLSLRTKGKN